LAACWSTPILSKSGALLGTFALYYREPRLPGREKEIVDLLVRTATLAIERHHQREQQKLLEGEMAHRVKNTPAVVLSIAGITLRSGGGRLARKSRCGRHRPLRALERHVRHQAWPRRGRRRNPAGRAVPHLHSFMP
jgi:hypothetical protein